jgi:hypothetical protein
MSRIGNVGAASNVMNGTGGNRTPTGWSALMRVAIVTVVPLRGTKLPVPPAKFALLGVNGALSSVQLMVVGLTVMDPAMLNVPEIGAAVEIVLVKPASSAVANRTLQLICDFSSECQKLCQPR